MVVSSYPVLHPVFETLGYTCVAPKSLSYDNLFRVLIVQFIDAQSFDLRSIKKTWIHIAHPDGERLIPFDTYNMFYRDGLEVTRLAQLRRQEMGIESFSL